MCFCGDIEAGEKATAKLRSIGKPIADVVGPHPFTGWQQAFDPLLTPGARNYWKSHNFMDEILTLPEVAQLFKVAEKTIYTMVSRHSGSGAMALQARRPRKVD